MSWQDIQKSGLGINQPNIKIMATLLAKKKNGHDFYVNNKFDKYILIRKLENCRCISWILLSYHSNNNMLCYDIIQRVV